MLKPFYGKISEKNHYKNLIVGEKQLDFIFLHQFKGTMPLACSIMCVGTLYLSVFREELSYKCNTAEDSSSLK